MKPRDPQFLNSFLTNVKTDVSVAAYTKVNRNWAGDNITPLYNKFYFVREGEGFVKLRDRVYYPRPGELYMLPAGVRQGYGTISDNTFAKYWCHFQAKVGDLQLFQVFDTPLCVQVEDHAALTARFEQLIRYAGQRSLTSALRVQSVMLELIAMYLDACEYVRPHLSEASPATRIGEVLTYIEEHLADNLSVDQLAQIAHFHPNYFIPLFKNLTGHPPIQYINRLRMEKAKRLLGSPEHRISEIAERVGMELPYFSRTFKEYAGLPPSAYREMLAGELSGASARDSRQTSSHPRPKA